ncbi:PepSY domain-containing protein [Aerococcus urinaeequi]|uniref:PepSY domain-containing protein n=1 Tax=Aerococcus urinaeequi TaxID=51665 RepID=A0AAE9XQ37_9LACT|nr:PepSY domain-containing protein [Aerococcus urinaeequi]WCG38105.1 PepSY domain-containing protein [Aerococcus urinaeequi]
MKLKTGVLTLFASVFLLAACGNSGQDDTTTSETAETTSQEASSNETSSETVPSSEDTSGDDSNESASSSEANQAASGEFISEDEAWQIALDDAGTTEDALTEREIELDDVDDDDDVAHYEIEFTVDGDREFEYDIDATTGDILNSEKDS